jgi:hypothetical protein
MSSLQQNWRKGQNRFCLEAGRGESEGVGARGEKWLKQCMHMWINEFLKTYCSLGTSPSAVAKFSKCIICLHNNPRK